MAEPTPPRAPLRVLHLNDQTGWGGGENQTWLLIRELENLGVENRVLVAGGGELEERLRAVLPADRIQRLARPLWPLAGLAVARLRGLCDVAHAHTGRAVPALALAGDCLRVAHRRMSHPPSRGGLRRLARQDLVICISEAVRRGLAASMGSDARARLAVIRSAVEPPRNVQAVMLPGEPAVGFLGHFNRLKGLDLLLDALPEVTGRHPRLVLHLVGEGPEEAELRSRAARLGLGGAVRFHPWQREPQNWLAALDLYLLPSREEGLGSSTLQAQALGIPVLATRAGGLPEAVAHGRTGWLVEADSAPALAAGLMHALADPARLAAWGAAGPAWVREEFSAGAMARQTLEAYREAMA
jgi:glycosyltransferase involved in cell wall biosynthesis